MSASGMFEFYWQQQDAFLWPSGGDSEQGVNSCGDKSFWFPVSKCLCGRNVFMGRSTWPVSMPYPISYLTVCVTAFLYCGGVIPMLAAVRPGPPPCAVQFRGAAPPQCLCLRNTVSGVSHRSSCCMCSVKRPLPPPALFPIQDMGTQV